MSKKKRKILTPVSSGIKYSVTIHCNEPKTTIELELTEKQALVLKKALGLHVILNDVDKDNGDYDEYIFDDETCNRILDGDCNPFEEVPDPFNN